MIAEPATTVRTLSKARPPERSTKKGEPVARPTPSSTIGLIRGDTSMAPMTTAVLPWTSPRVAIPTESTSWSQYATRSCCGWWSMSSTVFSRIVGDSPPQDATRFCVRAMMPISTTHGA